MPIPTAEQKLERKLTGRFNKALSNYGLIEDGDRILIAVSGGKDSLCLMELMARRMKVFRPKFEVEAVHVRMTNIHYATDTAYLENFAQRLGIKMHVVETGFDATTDHRKSPCFLCSWNRRKQLFLMAQQLQCNKIALGHHQDDIIHTALMNQFFQGHYSTMPVRLKMQKMPITIIRPLCLEEEADIARYAALHCYEKQIKQCPYEHDSNRTTVARLFSEIERQHLEARYSMWNALESEGKLIEE